MRPNKLRFVLYSRDYCHLCHDMLAALESMRGEFEPGFVIDVIDVDSDPALLVLYDELVPVLLVSLDDSGEQLRELCDGAAGRGGAAAAGVRGGALRVGARRGCATENGLPSRRLPRRRRRRWRRN